MESPEKFTYEFDTKFSRKASEEGCGILEIGGKSVQGGLRDS